MVLVSPVPVVQNERVEAMDLPVIDLSGNRSNMSRLIVKACERFGFFKVINHGVPMDVIRRAEAAGLGFFSLPTSEKQKSGPANPLGYGSRNIGFTGDSGEVEYLLLHTNPNIISQKAKSICTNEPHKFSCVLNEYVDEVRRLACEILDILGEGLCIGDRKAFSRLIRDRESDSLIRLNHYPSAANNSNSNSNSDSFNTVATANATVGKDYNSVVARDQQCSKRVGFGEHSDPQILTLLTSNNVSGLQILSNSATATGTGVWVSVPPDPTAFFVNVGDTLQALTNGRFMSVRHRAMVNSYCSRLSLVYFAAPPLYARISPLPEMVNTRRPRVYRSFTWSEYKKAMYSLRLGYNRLNLFRLESAADGEQPARN